MSLGFNTPPIVSGVANNQMATPQISSWLASGITQRDMITRQYQVIDTGFYRDFYTVQYTLNNSPVITPITPRPYINRIGSTSKPYRLLSGQEVQLSEDDVRVTGISKRYSLSQIWQWGMLYLLNPIVTQGAIDIGKSTLYELVFIDDSSPLYWVLNLRKRSDSRSNGADYDLP